MQAPATAANKRNRDDAHKRMALGKAVKSEQLVPRGASHAASSSMYLPSPTRTFREQSSVPRSRLPVRGDFRRPVGNHLF